MKMSKQYQIKGLELISHDKLDEPGLSGVEALTYRLSSGAQFSVAKDCIGVQICKSGNFFPYFCDYGTIEAAIDYLREHTSDATEFFDSLARREKASFN